MRISIRWHKHVGGKDSRQRRFFFLTEVWLFLALTKVQNHRYPNNYNIICQVDNKIPRAYAIVYRHEMNAIYVRMSVSIKIKVGSNSKYK